MSRIIAGRSSASSLASTGEPLRTRQGKPGVATFAAGMLDEGAGDLNSEAFQNRLEDLAAKMTINASYDHVTGSFQTLSENRDRVIQAAAHGSHVAALLG